MVGGREAGNLLFKVAEEVASLVCKWVAFLRCCVGMSYPGVSPRGAVGVV